MDAGPDVDAGPLHFVLQPGDVRVSYVPFPVDGVIQSSVWRQAESRWITDVEIDAPIGASPVLWMESAVLGSREVIATQDSTGTLQVVSSDNGVWTSAWSINLDASGARGFDVATIGTRIVVAYSHGGNLWQRENTPAGWRSAQLFGITTSSIGGQIEWVELEASGNGHLGVGFSTTTNQMLVGYQSSAGTRTFQLSGASAVLSTWQLTDGTKSRAFDIAFDSLGGLFCVWSETGSKGLWFQRLDGEILNTAANFFDTEDSEIIAVSLDGRDGFDQIAAVAVTSEPSKLLAAYWSGTTWEDQRESDGTLPESYAGGFVADVAWLGSLDVALGAYGDDEPGTVDWLAWAPENTGNRWDNRPDFELPLKKTTRSLVLDSQGDTGIIAINDTDDNLFVGRFVDGWEMESDPVAQSVGVIANGGGRAYSISTR